MEKQRLGKTNFYISKIGFGALAIGGFHYGKTKDKTSINTIKKALKLGINFFDTADVYGFGHSEKILSEGLGKEREKVIIATKVGVRWDKKKKESYYDLSSEYIKKAIKKNLSNLKIKSIPIYQIHYPDPKTPISETMNILNELKNKGKIKYIGCSNFTAGLIKKYQKYGRIESLQVPYNILDQKAEKYLFPICEKFNMGIIVYSPLAQGLLTGKYGIDTKFDNNDRRSSSKYFSKKMFKKIAPLLDKMRDIGNYYKKTQTQVALRWILDSPYVTSAIVGIKNIEELKEAVGADNWHLSKKERNILTKLGKEVNY